MQKDTAVKASWLVLFFIMCDKMNTDNVIVSFKNYLLSLSGLSYKNMKANFIVWLNVVEI
jgi:hypothetical protein